ncbi:MAG: hydantoinase B/oxoprolinase family protein [Chloroflexi bacterium]|nr:hydantoinase B/oxoprolinase family protein [Chloroflexota bacterium]
MALDPISLEVLRNKFDMVCAEMQVVLQRSAVSPVLKEAADCLNALFDVEGQVIAQSVTIPCHLGMIIPAVQRTLQVFPPRRTKASDVYIMNDPYHGGTHIPDTIMVLPVVVDGEVVAYCASIAHQIDMGGKAYGSKPMDATEIYQEGLIVPPLRLYDQGVRNETFYSFLRANVRLPDIVVNDIEAQLAGCQVGARRVASLCAEFGAGTVRQAMGELLDRSESMTRQCIRRIPEGTYQAVDYVDNDGVEVEKEIQVRLAVTVAGDGMTVDFTGSSPQSRGPVNSTPGSTMSSVYYAVRAMTDPTVPSNAGCFRPIRLIIPEGTVVNPKPPAPVNARMPTVHAMADAMFLALAQALPDRLVAASGPAMGPWIGGTDPLTGRTYVFKDFISGGVGATSRGDGVDVRSSGMGNSCNIPVEVSETDFPVRVRRFGLWQDSAGLGRYQGGLGAIKVYELLRGEAVMIQQSRRQTSSPYGLGGGLPGARQETTILRKDGTSETVPPLATARLQAGDQVIVRTAGGGGVGLPQDRDHDQVVEQVLDGKLSAEAAGRAYGVCDRTAP